MPRKAKSPEAKAKASKRPAKKVTTAKSAKAKPPAAGDTIRIQYYRSFIAAPRTHKEVVRSLGITKLNQIVERPNTPSMRGAVAKVPHLLRLVE
ncbi:MAG: 50S ribosomal protein L30 [Acidobacteria bacterium]|nr:MAG: 50S ribosomal protein L30 [Acidobacteriota bacterium]